MPKYSKQPVVQDRGSRSIGFDESCDLVELQNPTVTGTALIKRWSTECDIFNSKIEITGLSTSITDVLVRVQEHDKATKTFVLRLEPVLDLSQNDLSASYLMIGLEHLVFGIDRSIRYRARAVHPSTIDATENNYGVYYRT